MLSLSKLDKCHKDLQRVVKLAIKYSDVDFAVGETERTIEQQVSLVEKGKSHTLKSRHLRREHDTKGVHAVDLYAWVRGDVSWNEMHYKRIAKAMFRAAIELKVDIEWGGFWVTPEDNVHFQLSWRSYP